MARCAVFSLNRTGLGSRSDDVDELLLRVELHAAVREGEEGVIAAHADVLARVDGGCRAGGG